MSRNETTPCVSLFASDEDESPLPAPCDLMAALDLHGPGGIDPARLPFSLYDTTVGSEAELQAVVIGQKEAVDLPLTIANSHYLANIARRASVGDLPNRAMTGLEHHLHENTDQVWESSWVRFPEAMLGFFARRIFHGDLLAEKSDPSQGSRSDVGNFLLRQQGVDWIRVPISYLLKLSLAEAIDGQPPRIRDTGERLMGHFLCDNTSPETSSFQVVRLSPERRMGRQAAKEAAKRFLLTQLLVAFANRRFGLTDSGQRAVVFYSPHTPIRQKRLNSCISDSFYRELFMNPCLSGWNRGEAKQEYMHLCHRVLSLSKLNTLAKLREAGIINRNLVVLPHTSNTSLANNGTHISLGSRKLSALLQDPGSGFTPRHEKYLGDLVIKISEHFLPLFVGTYSANPYRLDFTELHPESALGFLPHELDFTHLRMLWRRWRKKADMRLFGQTVTPFGPLWLDQLLSTLLRLRGDFIPDYRLIDYLVALMSTEKSPALDGRLHNHDRLKQDLSELGVFDRRMSLYLFIKLREYATMGFSGFEGRSYSLFQGFEEDMAGAVDLQNLVTALAFKYIAEGKITHADIPDDPFIESERRQIVFGRAVGIPTFFVRRDTQNRLLRRIAESIPRVRPSRRYPGYLRVHHREYCLSLVRLLRRDAADLVEILGFGDRLDDLERRIEDPDRYSSLGKLTRAVLEKGNASSPLRMKAADFNGAAEAYYREALRERHFLEGFRLFEEDLRRGEEEAGDLDPAEKDALRVLLDERDASRFVHGCRREVIDEQVSPELLKKLIALVLLSVGVDQRREGDPA